MGRTRIETRARARALQALYAWDMRGGTELERVASQVWDDLAITPEERRVAGPIVRHVAQRQRTIDAELAEVTTNWRLERMTRVDRNVLRIGAWELSTRSDIPRAVILDEAVEIAKRYGTEESGAFVNGVLDRIADDCGRADEPSAEASGGV